MLNTAPFNRNWYKKLAKHLVKKLFGSFKTSYPLKLKATFRIYTFDLTFNIFFFF